MSTTEETIDIEVDDERIAGTFVAPGTLIPGVLFVHGWGGSRSQYLARARELAALGCVCLAFDLRGHAGTQAQQARVSRESNLRDLVAAYERLVAHPEVDPQAICVVGSSYGGYLAAILTTLKPVKWLALRAPALYLDAGWELPKLQLHQEQDLKTYRRSVVPPKDNRALRAFQQFEGDVLLIESENDRIIPHAVITSYQEAARQVKSLTLRCLAGADHGLSDEADQRAYTQVLVGWFKEMLLGARRGTVQPATADGAPPERPLPTKKAVSAAAAAQPSA
ncbi:alpha/beta hydrolase family protein [Rubrivivax gelatinosus]|uniref:Alpha/beta hydrolase n=1 Tax=Rubrivivax gelatinosus TaxID=28068 RepID=A0ABS1DUI3_RUBGE|nr:alpha/beta fold hydrolase [Rubrivivax gelatinosus]MBK1713133.1 alpha/beta hydrolase [Rubrivivax gelatinosus]